MGENAVYIRTSRKNARPKEGEGEGLVNITQKGQYRWGSSSDIRQKGGKEGHIYYLGFKRIKRRRGGLIKTSSKRGDQYRGSLRGEVFQFRRSTSDDQRGG